MWLVFVTKNNLLGPHFLRALASKQGQAGWLSNFYRSLASCLLANNEKDLRSRVLDLMKPVNIPTHH